MKNTFLVLAAALFLCAFEFKPLGEKLKQTFFPEANGPMWQEMAKAKIEFDRDKAVFTAIVPESIKAMSGKEVSIDGFIVPLESSKKQTHFLLAKRPPSCPYCMAGGPTEILDVKLKYPTAYSDEMVSITGIFRLVEDSKSGLYFRIEDATVQITGGMEKPKMFNQPPV